MQYDDFKNKLSELVNPETKPEVQTDLLKAVMAYTDEQNKRIAELEQSCNKIKQDYFDLAINNKRANDEIVKSKTIVSSESETKQKTFDDIVNIGRRILWECFLRTALQWQIWSMLLVTIRAICLPIFQR